MRSEFLRYEIIYRHTVIRELVKSISTLAMQNNDYLSN